MHAFLYSKSYLAFHKAPVHHLHLFIFTMLDETITFDIIYILVSDLVFTRFANARICKPSFLTRFEVPNCARRKTRLDPCVLGMGKSKDNGNHEDYKPNRTASLSSKLISLSLSKTYFDCSLFSCLTTVLLNRLCNNFYGNPKFIRRFGL